jgi:hypothetical protein
VAKQVWQEEPPPAYGRYDWPAIKRRLQSRPGEWTLVAEQVPRSVASAIRRDNIAALRDERWEFECRTRQTQGNLADLWMTARRREEG